MAEIQNEDSSINLDDFDELFLQTYSQKCEEQEKTEHSEPKQEKQHLEIKKRKKRVKEKKLDDETINLAKNEILKHLGLKELRTFRTILQDLNYNKSNTTETIVKRMKKSNFKKASKKLESLLRKLNELNCLDPIYTPIPIEIIYSEGRISLIKTRKVYKKSFGKYNKFSPDKIDLYPQEININYNSSLARKFLRQKEAKLIYGDTDPCIVHQIIDYHSAKGVALSKKVILGILKNYDPKFSSSRLENALNRLRILLSETGVIFNRDKYIYYETRINEENFEENSNRIKKITKPFLHEIISFANLSPFPINLKKFSQLLDISENLNHTEASLKFLLREILSYFHTNEISDFEKSALIVLYLSTFFNKAITSPEIFGILGLATSKKLIPLKFKINSSTNTNLFIENYLLENQDKKTHHLYFLKLKNKVESKLSQDTVFISSEIEESEHKKILERIEEIRSKLSRLTKESQVIKEEELFILESLFFATEQGIALSLDAINDEIKKENPNFIFRKKHLEINDLIARYKLEIKKIVEEEENQSTELYYLDEKMKKFSFYELLDFPTDSHEPQDIEKLNQIASILQEKNISYFAQKTLELLIKAEKMGKSIFYYSLKDYLNSLEIEKIDDEKLNEILQEIIEKSLDSTLTSALSITIKDFKLHINITEFVDKFISENRKKEERESQKIEKLLTETIIEVQRHTKNKINDEIEIILKTAFYLKSFTIETLHNELQELGLNISQRQLSILINSIQNLNSLFDKITPLAMNIEEKEGEQRLALSKKTYIRAFSSYTPTLKDSKYSMYPKYEDFDFNFEYFYTESKRELSTLYEGSTNKFKLLELLASLANKGFKVSSGVLLEFIKEEIPSINQEKLSVMLNALKSTLKKHFKDSRISLECENSLFFIKTKKPRPFEEKGAPFNPRLYKILKIQDIKKEYYEKITLLKNGEISSDEIPELPDQILDEIDDFAGALRYNILEIPLSELIDISQNSTFSKMKIKALLKEINFVSKGNYSKLKKPLEELPKSILFVLFKYRIQGKALKLKQIMEILKIENQKEFYQAFDTLKKRIKLLKNSRLRLISKDSSKDKVSRFNKLWYIDFSFL